jgi:hypothetical protein
LGRNLGPSAVFKYSLKAMLKLQVVFLTLQELVVQRLKIHARFALMLTLLIAPIVHVSAQPKPQNASLLFSGTSNLVSSTVTTFTLTNGTPAHIACIPQAVEYQTNQTWITVPLTGPSQRLVRTWTAVPEELRPGQARLFMVPPPYTNCNWRLVFYCQEQKVLLDATKDTIRHLTATNTAQASSRQFSGRHYLVTSPPIPAFAGNPEQHSK